MTMTPKVFVHGNPESDAIWSRLVDALPAEVATNVVLLSPPGFGAPSPDGWAGTQSGYVEWLVAELERIGGPVDIVGHDWGAGHVYGLVVRRPDLVNTWVADCAGLIHPDYVWHDAAAAWQTPEIGEAAVATLTNMTFDEKVAVLESLGMTGGIAQRVAVHINADMGRNILSLYRAAAQPAMATLGKQLMSSKTPRGCVVVPTADHYPGTPEMAREVARGLGADVVELDGKGHWWMIEDAATAAVRLTDFWSAAQG